MCYSPTVYVTDGAHKSQVQQFGEIVLHRNIYTQLSLEKRTMIHAQLERGITLAVIAVGVIDSPRRCLANFVETARFVCSRIVVLDVLLSQAPTMLIRPRRHPGLSCIAHRLRPAALWD
jgi:hypothetical protein